LRSAPDATDATAIVMSVGDPANVYNLPLPADPARDSFVRPRSRGALLVTINGVVVMIAERRGERILIRPETPDAHVTAAARALAEHLAARTSRDFSVETIDSRSASGSPYAAAFVAAGFKSGTAGLRFYKGL
ncbi:MAG TPA: hypothetical protein VIP11_03720, partial [Gemmatimonadaceae bacterium]